MTKNYIAVTGVAGFIGKHLTRKLLKQGRYVYGVDALTYAADPQVLQELRREYPEQFSFVARDIRELGRWPDVDAVIHLAAETHVDNSLSSPLEFVGTNVVGTAHLLEMTRAKSQHGAPHFIHISTDEVYGPITQGKADTDAPLRPTSPYAASKAAADLLVQSWGKTFSLPYSIIRPTNCYGSGQYPEKLIPKTVRSQMLGRSMTVHGNGEMVRQWLHVDDLCDAIILVLDKRLEGIWNVGGNREASVKDIVSFIQGLDGQKALTEYGYVRPACDQRYSVDDSDIRLEGWAPSGDFWRDLPGIVERERRAFRF